MNSKQINQMFLAVLLVLVLVGCFGIYHLIFLAEGWIDRIIVFFAYGCPIMFVFMGSVFYFCGMANCADLEERRQERMQNAIEKQDSDEAAENE